VDSLSAVPRIFSTRQVASAQPVGHAGDVRPICALGQNVPVEASLVQAGGFARIAGRHVEAVWLGMMTLRPIRSCVNEVGVVVAEGSAPCYAVRSSGSRTRRAGRGRWYGKGEGLPAIDRLSPSDPFAGKLNRCGGMSRSIVEFKDPMSTPTSIVVVTPRTSMKLVCERSLQEWAVGRPEPTLSLCCSVRVFCLGCEPATATRRGV
jgi:hypothetical protein